MMHSGKQLGHASQNSDLMPGANQVSPQAAAHQAALWSQMTFPPQQPNGQFHPYNHDKSQDKFMAAFNKQQFVPFSQGQHQPPHPDHAQGNPPGQVPFPFPGAFPVPQGYASAYHPPQPQVSSMPVKPQGQAEVQAGASQGIFPGVGFSQGHLAGESASASSMGYATDHQGMPTSEAGGHPHYYHHISSAAPALFGASESGGADSRLGRLYSLFSQP